MRRDLHQVGRLVARLAIGDAFDELGPSRRTRRSVRDRGAFCSRGCRAVRYARLQ